MLKSYKYPFNVNKLCHTQQQFKSGKYYYFHNNLTDSSPYAGAAFTLVCVSLVTTCSVTSGAVKNTKIF